MDVTEIERKIDRAVAAPIPVDAEIGGVTLKDMGQVMEFAKLMAVSGSAVPKYLRGNPGGCLAICSRALRWKMDPFAVAEKSYQVVNKGEERIAYEAQLVHAVITANAPLKNRLRYEITGEGDERRCRVWGTFKGETDPHSYTSETLGKMRDARGRNEYGTIKGSPLWDTMPEVQLAYSTVRQWCRLFASEVLLGVYVPEELEDGSELKVVPSVTASTYAEKLRQNRAARVDGRGFDQERINTIIEGEVNSDTAKQGSKEDERTEGRGDEPVADSGRQGQSSDRADDNRDQGGSGDAGGADREVRSEPAGEQATGAEASEADVFPADRKQPAQTKGKSKK